MSNVQEYTCPNCGGPLHFDATLQALKCDYCDSVYNISDMELANAKAEIKDPENWSYDSEMFSAYPMYNCTGCGAEVMVDKEVTATICPYCNNPLTLNNKMSGMEKPDYLIPFKVSKQQAIEALKKHYGQQKLIPDMFTAENTLREVKGVYVPFWLFNGVCEADIDYNAETIRVYRMGDEEVTETDTYLLERKGSVKFENIPVDASSRFPNEYMDAIEPFNYQDLTEFKTSYLAGFLAEKYNETISEVSNRADLRAANTTRSMVRRTTDQYSNVSVARERIDIYRDKVYYAFLPVWLLTLHWNDKDYLFAINGQNGKVAGELPYDKHKLTVEFVKSLIVGMIIIAAIIVAFVSM